jgi:hypothetical protein
LAAAVVSASLFATALHAQQPPGTSNQSAAEALFEEGMKLVDAKNYKDACPKLQQSANYDPAWGTLVNLADCYEKNGQSASAYVWWQNAEAACRDANQPKYQQTAHDAVARLAPKLARVKITATTAVDGLTIKRDGSPVSNSEWGVAIPTDQGKHTLEVSAPGRVTWKHDFDVPDSPTTIEVVIPTLEMAAAPPPTATTASTTPPPPASTAPTTTTISTDTTTTPPPGASKQKTVGLVLGAIGLVGAGIGTVFLVNATSKYSDSKTHCPRDVNLCDATGISERDDALKAGNLASAFYTGGAVLLTIGGALFLLAPSSSTASPTTSGKVTVTPTLGGASLQGVW